MRSRATLAIVGLIAASSSSILSQQPDSATTLRTVVVTAERSPAPMSSATASVSRIDAAQLAAIPNATVADALRLVPGFAIVDADGLGFEPRLMVRGFYGGGETEYAVVLVDGEPLNLLQSGSVAWETLPQVEAIEAIEIVRGSSSPLYGDAAIGAVINIITKRAVGEAARWSLSRGTFDTWRLTGGVSGDYLWRDGTISVEAHGTNGFREHGNRTAAKLSGGLLLRATDTDSVMLETRAHWREVDDPGPLLDSILKVDRSSIDPFFRYDRTRDRAVAVRVRGLNDNDRTRASASLGVERRLSDAFRTIPLSRDFGDTKARKLTATTARAQGQILARTTYFPGVDQFLVGVDATRGWLGSTYSEVMDGLRRDYVGAPEDLRAGWHLATGDATRTSAALFAQYSVDVTSRLRMSLGGRYDWLWDSFLPKNASFVEEPRIEASHSAFSPRAGLNVRYLDSDAAIGNAYLTVSRSFRAPTLDQLFDQRTFPPSDRLASNPLLSPQYGLNVEAGVYHKMSLRERATLSLSASAYQMDMKDELDFDIGTLRYVNIGRSRHRGVEAGVRLAGVGGNSLWLNHTIQSATARSGDNGGRALKAIPKHVTSAGASFLLLQTLTLGASLSHSRDIFLDDANTVMLPNYTRVDGSIAYRLRRVELFIDLTNVLDAEYSTTGFLDPAGSGAIFYHPAAGRTIQLGIRNGR